MKKLVQAAAVASIGAVMLAGCATGDTPEAKKKNALKETQSALQQIYEDHPSAQASVGGSKAI